MHGETYTKDMSARKNGRQPSNKRERPEPEKEKERDDEEVVDAEEEPPRDAPASGSKRRAENGPEQPPLKRAKNNPFQPTVVQPEDFDRLTGTIGILKSVTPKSGGVSKYVKIPIELRSDPASAYETLRLTLGNRENPVVARWDVKNEQNYGFSTQVCITEEFRTLLRAFELRFVKDFVKGNLSAVLTLASMDQLHPNLQDLLKLQTAMKAEKDAQWPERIEQMVEQLMPSLNSPVSMTDAGAYQIRLNFPSYEGRFTGHNVWRVKGERKSDRVPITANDIKKGEGIDGIVCIRGGYVDLHTGALGYGIDAKMMRVWPASSPNVKELSNEVEYGFVD